jgi:hypothetical protein
VYRHILSIIHEKAQCSDFEIQLRKKKLIQFQ